MMKKFTLSCAFMLGGAAMLTAQSNLNFENWTGNEANGWVSSNPITQVAGGDQTVFKESTDPAQGSFSVKMVTGDCPDCPNFALLGPFGPPTPLPNPLGGSIQLGSFDNPGIPYTQRPISVDFRFKANPAPNDACGLHVELTRFNAATEEDETIGEGFFEASADVNTWTTMNIPIAYYSDLAPDRLNIWATSSIGSVPDLSAFGLPDLPLPTPVAGSEFYIDAIVLNLPSCDDFAISMSGSGESSLGAMDGTASVTPSGGTPPYTYSWNTLDNTQSISGLIPGAYVVTVTDANQCQKVGTYYVAIGGCNLSLSISGSNSSSNSIYTGNGSATVTASGGNGPYTYTWNTGATTPSINNLAVGTYAVLVTEQNNPLCASWAYFTVYGPDGPTISVEENIEPKGGMLYFPNPSQGLITFVSESDIRVVEIYNAAGQLVNSWNNNSSMLVADLSAQPAGVYSFRLTDERGEVQSGRIVVE
jgi:SprB repeat/Secretion system C-terminal sorting domain